MKGGRADDHKRSPTNRRLFGPIDHNQNKLDADHIWTRLNERSRTRVRYSPSFRRRRLAIEGEGSSSEIESEGELRVDKGANGADSSGDVYSRPRYSVHPRSRDELHASGLRSFEGKREVVSPPPPRSGFDYSPSSSADAGDAEDLTHRPYHHHDRFSEHESGNLSPSAESFTLRRKRNVKEISSTTFPSLFPAPSDEAVVTGDTSTGLKYPRDPSTTTCCPWRAPAKLTNDYLGEKLDLRRPSLYPDRPLWQYDLDRRPLFPGKDARGQDPQESWSTLKEETVSTTTTITTTTTDSSELRRIPVVRLQENQSVFSQRCYFRPITTRTGSRTLDLDENWSRGANKFPPTDDAQKRKRKPDGTDDSDYDDDDDDDNSACWVEAPVVGGSGGAKMFDEGVLIKGVGLSRSLTEKLKEFRQSTTSGFEEKQKFEVEDDQTTTLKLTFESSQKGVSEMPIISNE